MSAEIGTLLDLLRARAYAHGEALAFSELADDGSCARSLTFGELERQAQALGVVYGRRAAPGARVVLAEGSSLDFVKRLFGLLYAGLVPVPAPAPTSQTTARRLEAQARDCDAVAWIGPAVASAPSPLAHFERWDEEWLANVDTASELPPISPRSDEVAFLQYTSGSTSSPRGVVVTHRAILANERDIARAFEHDDTTVFASWLPPFHDMGLIGGILQPMYLGIPCYLLTPLQFVADPGLWLRVIGRYRVTTSGGPNFAYELCLQRVTDSEREQLDLSSWRVAFNGAEPVRADTLARFAATFASAGFRRRSLMPCYGLAEATLFVSGSRAAVAPLTRPSSGSTGDLQPLGESPTGGVHVSSGRPADSLEVAIVDPVTACPLPDGEEGEIWIAGDSVADRYFRHPGGGVFGVRLSARPKLRFLRSGDLGFLCRGELFVTGRIKDLLLVQGRNVHPADVEIAAATVRICDRRPLVAAVEDPSGPGRVVVIVEVPAGIVPPADAPSEVRAAVAAECGVHVQTVVLLLGGRLPRTTSGKLQRAECARLFATGSLGTAITDVDTAPPVGDATEHESVDVWQMLANALSSVDLEPPTHEQRGRSPVEHGLSSLDAIRLASALTRLSTVSLAVSEILGARSFESLVDRLREGTRAVSAPTRGAPTSLPGAVEAMVSRAIRDPGRVAENLSIALSLPPSVATDACRRAVTDLAARHSSLRTTLLTTAGTIGARVRADIDPWLEQAPSCESLADALVDVASRPFDLATEPLMRACIHDSTVGAPTLQLVFHHAAVDFWSLRQLFCELDATLCGDPVPEPAPLVVRKPTVEARVRAQRYWRRVFPDAVSLMALPAAPPTGQRLSGRALTLELSHTSARALRQRAAALAVTPAALQLAAFQALLALYGGRRQIITAVPFLNRDAAILDAICCRVNVLPVVSEFDDQACFGNLARKVHWRLLELQSLQDVPFAEAGITMVRQEDRSPATQFGFVPYDSPGDGSAIILALRGHRVQLDFAGGRSTAIPVERFEPNADLLLATAELGGRLMATIEFDAGRVHENFARDFALAWKALMTSLAFEEDATSQSVSQLCRPVDRAAISSARGSRREPPGTNAFDLLERRARRWPDVTAVEYQASAFTYRELLGMAYASGAELERRGVSAGDRIAMTGRSRPELAAAILGMWSLGAVYCPIDPDYPAQRRTDIEARLRARMTVSDPSLLQRLTLDQRRNCVVSPADPAYVIFTSGSSGRPKGVVLPHRGLVNTISAQSMFGLVPGRRVLQASALGFDASIFEIVLALAHGATLVIPPTRIQDGAQLTSAIEELDIDCAVLSPSLIAAMDINGPVPSTLIAAGEACPNAVVRAWAPRCELFNAYGPTECSIWATVERLSAPEDEPLIGRPICNVDVAVVDGGLRPVPVWAPGELVIGGAGVGLGYLDTPDARFLTSADALSGSSGYRTGDRVRMRSDGRLEFLGRNDRQVKVRGLRIELGDVETALGRCCGVERAVALLLRPHSEAAAIAAAVTVAPGDAPSPEQLRRELRSQLPAAAVPVSIRVLDRLPVDAHGKVDTRQLQAALEGSWERGPRPTDTAATPTERLILSVCEQILDIAPAGADSNLLELGVHSLNAVRIVGRLSQVLRREVPVAALFEYPEIGALAAFLDRFAASWPAIELERQAGAKGVQGGARVPEA